MGNEAESRSLVYEPEPGILQIILQNCTVATRDSLNPIEIIKIMFLKHFLPPRREGKWISYCWETKS